MPGLETVLEFVLESLRALLTPTDLDSPVLCRTSMGKSCDCFTLQVSDDVIPPAEIAEESEGR